MNYRLILGLILIIDAFSSPAQSNDSGRLKSFTLIGKINDYDRGTIYLLYSKEKGRVLDSSVIKNGRFFFKGIVNEPTYAELSLNSPNSEYYAEIFIEPGRMKVKAEANSFRFLKMNGSASQKDNEKLNYLKRNSWLKLAEVQTELKTIMAAKKLSDIPKADSLEKEVARLEKKVSLLEKEIYNADSLFITQNPESYVTAYQIYKNLQFENFLLYPIDSFYYKMPVAVKMSSYGKSILWQMNKVKRAPVGSKAPLFNGTTLNGNKISLTDFKEKNYVLLDFWGSWCGPCRRLNAALKNIYRSYNGKGLEIISIAINDKEDNWRKAVIEDSTGIWQHVRDDSNSRIGDLYSANWVPAFFLIDKEGKIIGRYSEVKGYGEKAFYELYQDLNKIFTK